MRSRDTFKLDEEKFPDESFVATDVDINIPPRDSEIIESRISCEPSLSEPGKAL